MAFPTVTYNNITGSASAASGAGPATALTGTSASFTGQVVTLDGDLDLSGVNDDGSHVLYLATDSGIKFFKIEAKNDTGTADTDTVTVVGTVEGTATGLTWAIGGKRNSPWDATDLAFLASGGGILPGWTADIEETGTAYETTGLVGITFNTVGNLTDGPTKLTSSSSTRPEIKYNGSGGSTFVISTSNGSHIEISNLKITQSRSTGTVTCITTNMSTNNINFVIRNCEFVIDITGGAFLSFNRNPNDLLVCGNHFNGVGSAGTPNGVVFNNSNGNDPVHGSIISDNFFDGCGIGVSGGRSPNITIDNNIFDECIDPIKLSSGGRCEAWRITGNTIYNPTNDGVDVGASNNQYGLILRNNIIYAGAGAGFGYSVHTLADHPFVFSDGNSYYGHSSGVSPAGTPLVLGARDITTDPGMANPGNNDFTLGSSANAKAAGTPGSFPGLTGNENFRDIGAIQREESPSGVPQIIRPSIINTYAG
jgi:hypothetical protein